MHLAEGGQGWTRGEEGLKWLRRKLEDESALRNVAHVVLVEAGDCIIEVDGVEEGHGSAGLDKGDGIIGLTAGQENEKHGDKGGGPLHAGVAMDKNGVAGMILCGNSVDPFKRPKARVSDFLGLEIVVNRNTIHSHGGVQGKGNVLCTVEDGLNTVAPEPLAAGGGLEVAEPETWDDFVGPCRACGGQVGTRRLGRSLGCSLGRSLGIHYRN